MDKAFEKRANRSPRLFGRALAFCFSTLLGLAVCVIHLLPYYYLWAEADPISYGWGAMSLAIGSLVLLAAAVCSVLIGRLWLKGFSLFTTAALLFANLTILYMLLGSLLQLLPIAKVEPVLLASHISAAISVIAIVGLAADSVRLLRRVWKTGRAAASHP